MLSRVVILGVLFDKAAAYATSVNRSQTVSVKLSISCYNDNVESRCAFNNAPGASTTFVWTEDYDPLCVPLGYYLNINILRFVGHVESPHWCLSGKTTVDPQDNLIAQYGGADVNQDAQCESKRAVVAIGDCIHDVQGSASDEHMKICYQGLC